MAGSRGRSMLEMGGFLTTFSISSPAPPSGTIGKFWRSRNLRGRTYGWIGLITLLKELFNATSI